MSDNAYRKVNGEWVSIPHRSADKAGDLEVPIPTIREVLKGHAFQEMTAPGLYPTQDTVCSCGATPGSRPDDGDDAWWIDHVVTVLAGEN